ncbi:probable 39S ribosomal protein L49, mitochondrial [Copidosoma floridanum]|uniref:probable 39S ribosomal protein L49, mitochondrial n=1 Tax=Copidosoma floridanum TaxID=29053 RepID=UPI0006C97585|nr:probable 39S ribosomal protein L49, mitochondrial [Copidosoma floridanum]
MATALYFLGRAAVNTLLKSSEVALAPAAVRLQNQTRSNHIDFKKINVEKLDESQLTDFEVSTDPKEWQFVERILPLKTVPYPKKFNGPAPSGWVPPKEEARELPYFIQRNKNHMQPVYLELSYRNSRKITCIRLIQGDIWQLEKDIKMYLQKKSKNKHLKEAGSRVSEIAGTIKFRGDYVSLVKAWMDMKGF